MAATYLTLAEAAQLTGKSVKTMRRLAHQLHQQALADGTPAVRRVAKPGGFGYAIAYEALGLSAAPASKATPAARPPRKPTAAPAAPQTEHNAANLPPEQPAAAPDTLAAPKPKSGNGKKKKTQNKAEAIETPPASSLPLNAPAASATNPPIEDTLPKGQRAPDRAVPMPKVAVAAAPPLDVWRELLAAKDAMIAALQAELQAKNEQIRHLLDSKEHSDILLKVLTDRLALPSKPMLAQWSNAELDDSETKSPLKHETVPYIPQKWQAAPDEDAPSAEGFGAGVDAAINKVRKLKDKKKRRK